MNLFDLVLIRQAMVIVASALGAYTDAKTGYIFDWITLPLILIGFLLNVFEQQFFGVLIGVLVFFVGYFLYYIGKIGGGDVKLYTGIAMTLPFFNNEVFIVNVAFFSALAASLFFSVFYVLKYAKKGIDFEYNKEGLLRGFLFAIVLLVYFYFLWKTRLVSRDYLLIVGIPMFSSLVFVSLEKGIRKEFFLKKIKLSEVEDDELIAFEFMSEKNLGAFKKKIKGVYCKEDLVELEKKGVKELLVYRNLPRLGPFIFLGVLLAMMLPSLSVLMVKGF